MRGDAGILVEFVADPSPAVELPTDGVHVAGVVVDERGTVVANPLAVERDDGLFDGGGEVPACVVLFARVDEDGDGRPDRRLTYSNGALTLIETERDESGIFRRSVRVE